MHSPTWHTAQAQVAQAACHVRNNVTTEASINSHLKRAGKPTASSTHPIAVITSVTNFETGALGSWQTISQCSRFFPEMRVPTCPLHVSNPACTVRKLSASADYTVQLLHTGKTHTHTRTRTQHSASNFVEQRAAGKNTETLKSTAAWPLLYN
jgi:hypothetical protein